MAAPTRAGSKVGNYRTTMRSQFDPNVREKVPQRTLGPLIMGRNLAPSLE